MNNILCKRCMREFSFKEEREFDSVTKEWVDLIPELCPDCIIDSDDDMFPTTIIDSKFNDVLEYEE